MRALFLDKEASSKKEKPLDGLFDTATKFTFSFARTLNNCYKLPYVELLKLKVDYLNTGPIICFKTAPFRHTINIRITFKTKDYRSTLVYSDYIDLIVSLLVVVILKYCSSDLLR